MTTGRPLLAGLTGGMGSGKSSVLRLLAERGAETVSADLLAREAVAPGTPGLARVIEAFGRTALRTDGSLDRSGIARTVFADAAARRTLEAIIHPLVLAGEEAAIAAWEGRGRPVPLVVESPLLLEIGRQGRYDLVILVTCPVEIRLARLRAAGGDAADAAARIAAQWQEERTVPLADRLVDNGGMPARTVRQVDALLPLLLGETPYDRGEQRP